MKKIYLLLLLTITTLTALCMEREHSWLINDNSDATEISLDIFTPSQSYPQSMYTNAPPSTLQHQQTYNALVNTNYQKYNSIMDAPYRSTPQPMPTTNTNSPLYSFGHDATKNLVPVYTATLPQNTTNFSHLYSQPQTKEKKSLLKTTPQTQPDNSKLMAEIYDKAYGLMMNAYDKKPHSLRQNQKLARVIDIMNNAHNKDISDDSMGKFAYNKQNEGTMPLIVTLFFSCLKRYTLTVAKTGESLPFGLIQTPPSSLADIFNTPSNARKKYKTYTLDLNAFRFFTSQTHPALTHLADTIHALVDIEQTDAQYLTDCFYAQQPKIKPIAEISYTNLKNEFYDKTYNLLFNNGNSNKLHEIIRFIEKAKELKNIGTAKNLGFIMLYFKPEKTPLEMITSLWDTQDSTTKTQNRIALLCALIDRYTISIKQNNKETPTVPQHSAYAFYRDFKLISPDNCVCEQLNKKHYAFAEFKELVENVSILMNTDDNKVAQEVIKQYPQTQLT